MSTNKHHNTTQHKLQRSLSSIWWSYWEPEHMFSCQEVTFDRVPIWSHHWLQFRIIVMRSSWMSSIFRIVAIETCLHSHRGRFQGRGWSREQQQQCRLRSNRCSIPPPLSIPPSPSFPALSTNSSFVTIGNISTQTHTFDLQLLSVSRNAPTRCIVFLLRLKSTTKEMFTSFPKVTRSCLESWRKVPGDDKYLARRATPLLSSDFYAILAGGSMGWWRLKGLSNVPSSPPSAAGSPGPALAHRQRQGRRFSGFPPIESPLISGLLLQKSSNQSWPAKMSHVSDQVMKGLESGHQADSNCVDFQSLLCTNQLFFRPSSMTESWPSWALTITTCQWTVKSSIHWMVSKKYKHGAPTMNFIWRI